MIRKHKHPLNLIFLAVFLFVTLFINYFHTEAVINGFNEEKATHTHSDRPNNPKNHECPACHFLNVTLITSQIHFFYLPPPAIFGIFESQHTFTYTSIFLAHPSSRSPPAA
jgi:hypothetical protein